MNILVFSLALVLGLTEGYHIPNNDPIILPEVFYEGMAYPDYDHDKNPVMIPVEECPHGCAV